MGALGLLPKDIEGSRLRLRLALALLAIWEACIGGRSSMASSSGEAAADSSMGILSSMGAGEDT